MEIIDKYADTSKPDDRLANIGFNTLDLIQKIDKYYEY